MKTPHHHEPTFDFLALSEKAATKALKDNLIALSVAEAKHFQKEIGRPLTLTELTVLSIQGSEHCSYRSSRRHLKHLPTKGKNVILGPGEDAGIIEIAREGKHRWGLVVGHESHNHPSQLVPYEGAATGIGGCVRDILCMGARVIGVLDPLRFGDPSKHLTRWLTREVVSGIASYGNPLGVPNLGGDIEFDPSFDANCLVNVVALGVLRDDELIHSFVPEEAARVGYDIIVVGKPTDRSGFGGASFASADLSETDAEANKGAVQEPNPFLERHLLVATYDLFTELKQRKLLDKVSFKDMGAGGNVCASVEQVEPRGFGAEIDLEKIHTAKGDFPPHIIACAETQERFCWICHPSVTQLILDTYNQKWELPRAAVGARASVVGKVKTGNYVLKYHGAKLVDTPPSVLTEGLSYCRQYKRAKSKIRDNPPNWRKLDLAKVLEKLLASPQIASRAPIYEKYDKQVQGATTADAGLGGSGIIQPLLNTTAPVKLKKIGIAIGLGGSSTLGQYSAKLQAEHAVAEAVTNVVATGATPLALTDCLNYGNPERSAQMAELVDGIAGLRQAAEIFKTPFVSGNVSLYNQNSNKSINPSAIVACFGRLNDASKATPSKLQAAGNALVLVGTRASQLGGSALLNSLKKSSSKTFSLDLNLINREVQTVLKANRKGWINSARDLHRGGIGTAACEMAFGTGLGLTLDLADLMGNTWSNLFAESPGFLLEVAPKNLAQLGTLATRSNVTLTVIGQVIAEPELTIVDSRKVLIQAKITKLEKIWSEGLRKILLS